MAKYMVLTSPGQWFVPFARKLQGCFENCECVFDHTEINKPYDVLFILSYSKIIPNSILALNQNNIVVHSSDLPKGKGWSPMFWQLLEGSKKISFSLFEANSSVDEGDIYFKKELSLTGYELNKELRQKQAEFIISMCIEFIENHSKYKNPTPQEKGGTIYRRRTAKDSELDINQTIKQQFNLLRIVDNENYPAFFEVDDHQYKITITEIEK